MSNSEASFLGTGSLSPTTDDIRSFSKRQDARFEEKLPAEVLHNKSILITPSDLTKRPQDVSIKVQKGIQFTVQKTSTAKPVGAKTIAKRSCYLLLGISVALMFIALSVMFVIIPLVFSTNLSLRRHLMFVGWFRNAPHDLQNPAALGLPCSVFLPIGNDGAVASWYVPPSDDKPCKNDEEFVKHRPSVLIVPSFEEARSNPATLALLKMLSQKLQFHVLVFDYKGTADSSDVLPSMATVLGDTTRVYQSMQYKMQKLNYKEKILVWGQTWGAPIAMQLLLNINETSRLSLILQSPVESTSKAAGTALSFNVPWRWLPFFVKAFVEPLERNRETNVDTLKIIKEMPKVPTLIIHAADDDVVDIRQGRRVYEAMKAATSEERHPVQVEMYEIPERENVGHVVAQAEGLAERVSSFLEKTFHSDSSETIHHHRPHTSPLPTTVTESETECTETTSTIATETDSTIQMFPTDPTTLNDRRFDVSSNSPHLRPWSRRMTTSGLFFGGLKTGGSGSLQFRGKAIHDAGSEIIPERSWRGNITRTQS